MAGPERQFNFSPRVETDSSILAKMLRQQTSNYEAFTRTADSIKVDLIQEKWEFEDVLESLNSRWRAINALHWEIDRTQGTKDISSEFQYSICEFQYTKIKRLINIKMWQTFQFDVILHNENNKSTSNSHVSQGNLSETLLSTALIRVQAADNSLITLRALIDQGSQVSLISEHAAQMLKLPRDRSKGVVFGIGAKESTCQGVINIKCMAIHNDYTLRTNVYVMRSLIHNLPNNSFQKPQWSFLENIQLADPDSHISRPVDLLLGADVYSTIIQEGIIRHEKTQPVAQQTRFGWILCDHVQTFQCNVVLNNIGDIQNFWSVEDIPATANMSQEDPECQQQDTTTRNEDGRYVVKYPFTHDMEEKLGASKPIAAAQFRNLERKSSRLTKLPRAFIEYQSQNYMAECTSNMTPSCYLPHHGMECADSSLRNELTSTSYTLNNLMKHDPKHCNLNRDVRVLAWVSRARSRRKDPITNKCITNIALRRNTWIELSTINSYLFYCCGQCSWRIICEDRISAIQVEKAGVIALGQDCLIQGQDFTVFAHKNHQHIINISVPVLDIITTQFNNNQTTVELRDIKQRIEQMKSETALAEGISYHDVHQYAAIYGLIAGCLTITTVYVFRCVRQRRRRGASSAQTPEDSQPSAATPCPQQLPAEPHRMQSPRRPAAISRSLQSSAAAVYATPRPRQRPPQPPQPNLIYTYNL